MPCNKVTVTSDSVTVTALASLGSSMATPAASITPNCFRVWEFTQETTFSDYKDFDGIKKATKVSSKRNGEKSADLEISEFKVLDNVDPETFARPK